jgi:hypothetical protein
MRKTTAAVLIGTGAGFALAWLFRGRLRGMFDEPAEIVVDNGIAGPFVSYVTPEVVVKKNKHVRWQVTNNSTAEVLVALEDWQDPNHQPAPPAVSADPDDHEHPPQRGLSRQVPGRNRHPGRRPLRGKARAPRDGDVEDVKYAVHLNGRLAVDPIVKLIL